MDAHSLKEEAASCCSGSKRKFTSFVHLSYYSLERVESSFCFFKSVAS